jgi:hypothetical protein
MAIGTHESAVGISAPSLGDNSAPRAATPGMGMQDNQKPIAEASCCSPSEQATCCAPAAKASCCGAASSSGCGCR